MATFNELIYKVGDWANRDDLFKQTAEQVMNNEATSTKIKDFLDIAMKRVNNTLRIPPMEQLTQVEISKTGDDLTIPADMIEPIYIRTLKIDTAGNESAGLVYNAKVGSRNFADSIESGISSPTYSRRANKYTFNPPLSKGEVVELYYYRVLPDLDATFPIGTCTGGTAAGSDVKEAVCTAGGSSDNKATWVKTADGTEEVPQWFRDEAEEVLLYGALSELFAFLGEEMDQERWHRKFEDKLTQLREEEAYREWRGGTIISNIITNNLI